jgi:Leucine-rich repeat (LRR) protein
MGVKKFKKDEEWAEKLLQWLNENADESKTNIPRSAEELLSLKELNLASAEISKLPPEIGNLKNLWSLDLFGNPISKLPPELEKMEYLNVDI